jgi:glyoxylase-like metal-dependent hydrolase (beta-lactamase superfamily II)
MVSVRWTGAAGLEFTHEGKTWLIDPYLSRVGKASVFFGRPQADREKISRYLDTLPGKLQAVVVGHTHLDHALDIPEILRRFPVPLVGSGSLETLMALHGMPGKVAVCKERTRVDLPGGASVTMIPSLHGLVLFGRAPYAGEIEPGQKPPLKASHYRHGRVFNIRLEIGREIVPARRHGQSDRRRTGRADLRCAVPVHAGMENDPGLPRPHPVAGQAEDRDPLPFR